MDHITGNDRSQIQFSSLEQMVGSDSFVRIIDAFVGAVDLSRFGFRYFELSKEGRPPYHPSVMLKLYMYGYHYGLRSCRKLERACIVDLEVMWLLNSLRPSYKTIANFRKDNSKAFRQVFRYFVLQLKEWGLVEGQTIAIDSFKIRAQNSLKNNYNERKIKRHLNYIDNKITEYEQALDEDPEPEKAEEIKDKITNNKGKKSGYESLKWQLKDSTEGQISLTDPDSKAVVFQRNSVKVGYNIQAASDSKHKLLIAMDTGDVNNTKALTKMIVQVQENIDERQMNVLADKGYHSGREIKECEQQGVTTFISPKESSSTISNPEYAMTNFKYDPETDTYCCPAGEILQTNGRTYYKKLNNGRKSYSVKHYKTKACNGCHQRSQCTKNKNGRLIERSEYQQYISNNNERVNLNPEYYRQRQQIIEHQFGTLKRQWGFEFTLVRGKPKVLGEVALIFTLYNLRRCVSILSFEELMSRIKAHFIALWQFLNLTGKMNVHMIR